MTARFPFILALAVALVWYPTLRTHAEGLWIIPACLGHGCLIGIAVAQMIAFTVLHRIHMADNRETAEALRDICAELRTATKELRKQARGY